MKNTCNECSSNLNNKNYCIIKKCINSKNTFCYECVHDLSDDNYKIVCSNIDKIVNNVPIIHLDKYNDDFSFYEYFLRK